MIELSRSCFRSPIFRTVSGLLAVLFAAAPAGVAAQAQNAASPVVQTVVQATQLRFEPRIAYASATLRVVGPSGFAFERAFGTGAPVFDLASAGGRLADGQYRYELTLGRVPSPALRAAFEANAFRDDGTASSPALAAELDALRATDSGSFLVAGGQIMVPAAAPTATPPGTRAGRGDTPTTNDQVIPDDLIVQGSACVGLDCVNNESFGFSTIVVKENNTRITFTDTSTGAGFPAHSWQLTANDSASGGLDKFSIEDLTAGRIPFTLVGNAPTNSLFVDSTGRVGLRTSTPVLDIHVDTGNTPALRFEQDATGGFTPQTWDVAGNEANFFVRDVTGGGRLPLRIRPGAPTSSIDVASSGNVGIGTASPQQALHINRGAADAILRIEQTASAVPAVWDIKNNSATGRLTISDASGLGARVPFKIAPGAADNLLRIGVIGLNTVDINGNLFVTGTITPDYVFDPEFSVESIDAHSSFMWENRHLPAVAPAQVNEEGRGIVDVGARSQGLLEELEKAHIYIEQLHSRIKELKDDAQTRAGMLDELRREVDAIKRALGT